MKVYIVTKIINRDCGYRKVVGAFSTQQAAESYIDMQGDQCPIKLRIGDQPMRYVITEYLIQD